MTQEKKPEIHIEMSCGFFRIPTETVNYNITVLESKETSATRVVERIVEVEKAVTPEPVVQESPSAAVDESQPPPPVDEYYKEAVFYFSNQVGLITTDAGELLSSVADIGASKPEYLERLNDIVEMTEEANENLSVLKDTIRVANKAVDKNRVDEDAAQFQLDLKGMGGAINQAQELINEIMKQPATALEPPPTPKKKVEKKLRFLFNIDAVFQTIYELCTNETVKEHVQSARAKASKIFDSTIFLDTLSINVPTYSEDDGFYSVPLSDVLGSLAKSCKEKKVVNLLKKMNQQQADIFLDQFLPLEVPPSEEIEIEIDEPDFGEEKAPSALISAEPDSRLADVAEIINSSLDTIDKLVYQATELNNKKETGQDDQAGIVVENIENAINILGSISFDVKDVASILVKNGVQTVPVEDVEEWFYALKAAAMGLADCLKQKDEQSDAEFGKVCEHFCLKVDQLIRKEKEEAQAARVAKLKAMAIDNTPVTVAKRGVIKAVEAADEILGDASQDDIDKLMAEFG